MQIGVSSYSYIQSSLDTFEMIKEAKKTGFDVIEFAGLPNLPEGETACKRQVFLEKSRPIILESFF